MADKDNLLREVSQLEQTLLSSAKLGDDEGRAMVELRRRIAATTSAIATIGDAVFAADPLRSAFKTEFSKMRAATALHHASWPIVAIDRKNSDYQLSIKTTREANRRFITWVRDHCGDAFQISPTAN